MDTPDSQWLTGLGINQEDPDGDQPITNGITTNSAPGTGNFGDQPMINEITTNNTSDTGLFGDQPMTNGITTHSPPGTGPFGNRQRRSTGVFGNPQRHSTGLFGNRHRPGVLFDNVQRPATSFNTQGSITNELPTINLPSAWASSAPPPPPPPRPSFLPTPPQQPQQPQMEAMQTSMEELFSRAERAQNNRERRLQNSLEVQNRRRSSEIRCLDNKLRTLHGGLQEINGGIAYLKRRAEYLENQAEIIRNENREAKRRATEENNVVRGVLMNHSRLAGDRHRAMDQRLTEMETSSRKTEKKVTKLEKTIKNAASEFRKLGDVVEKGGGSAGDRRCLGCLASNFVCVHHVVGSDAVPPFQRREKENENEDSESQRTDTSSANRAKGDSTCSRRPMGGRTKRRTRSGQ